MATAYRALVELAADAPADSLVQLAAIAKHELGRVDNSKERLTTWPDWQTLSLEEIIDALEDLHLRLKHEHSQIKSVQATQWFPVRSGDTVFPVRGKVTLFVRFQHEWLGDMPEANDYQKWARIAGTIRQCLAQYGAQLSVVVLVNLRGVMNLLMARRHLQRRLSTSAGTFRSLNIYR